MPDEEFRPETLAAALDSLHTVVATSSRDWQTYRADAWLWAVLCGWDCEQAEHDEACSHGVLEETAAMHGWDADTVAKARRYRAAVRAVVGPAPPVQQPGVSPAEIAERIAARHRCDGWHDRAQGAQDVADLLRTAEREERQP